MKFLNKHISTLIILFVLSLNCLSKDITNGKKRKHPIHILHSEPHIIQHQVVSQRITIGGEMTNIAPTATKVITPRIGKN